jgi:urease accessory protein
MLVYTHRIDIAQSTAVLSEVVLRHEQRRRTRQRAALADGTPIAIDLPRSTIMCAGDVLSTISGELLVVRAALEELSVIYSDDQLLLTRLAYHLGNRHAAVQINASQLAFLFDPVLNQLCEKLGLSVAKRQMAFEPETVGLHGHG